MKRTTIKCSLCPCKFITQTDVNHHMKGFTTDPVTHLRLYVDNMSYPRKIKRRRGGELFREYLTDRDIKPRPAPKRPKRPKGETLDQRRKKYASKIEGFQRHYCRGSYQARVKVEEDRR